MRGADPQLQPAATAPEGPHLFVVSNLGQVRNAASVIQQLSLRHATLLVLWTADASELRDLLLGAATEYRLEATSLELPRSPTDPFPSRIGRITHLYDALPGEIPARSLWLSNFNSHYGYLAHRFAARGAGVCLFEEGLGTYRRVDDPAFGPWSSSGILRSVANDITAAVLRDDLTLKGRIRRIGYRIAVGAFRSSAGRWINSVLSQSAARAFYEPHRWFDTAVVSFPEALDEQLVAAKIVLRLEHCSQAEAPVDAAAKQWVDEWQQGEPEDQPLFLSQRYDVEPQRWARAIADTLLADGVTRLTVKFHPRESQDERQCLLVALASAGISAATDPGLDRWPAENLLRAGLSSGVIGITSSALVYRAAAIPHRTIAPQLLRRLAADARVPRRDLARLRQDTELLLRVMREVDAA